MRAASGTLSRLGDESSGPVHIEHLGGLADCASAAAVEPDRPVAQAGYLVKIVAHEQDRRPGPDHALDLVEAAVAKCPVDDGQHLVEDVDVSREAHADREREA